MTSWGHDLPDTPPLGELVRAVLDRFPELVRLRMSSLDGIEIDPLLFDLFAGEERLMPHLHLSLQHGHDLILKRMKRRHLRSDAIALVTRLKERRPDIAIGADLIAGFPTETESEMRETFDWALSSRLNSCSFFIVNAHPGTVLYEQAKAEGLDVDYAATSHNYMDPDFSLSEVPTPKLRRMMRTTYLRFLLNPVRIWRTLRAVPRVSILGSLVWDLLHRLFRDFRGQELDSYDAEGIPDYERLRILRDQGSYNRI